MNEISTSWSPRFPVKLSAVSASGMNSVKLEDILIRENYPSILFTISMVVYSPTGAVTSARMRSSLQLSPSTSRQSTAGSTATLRMAVFPKHPPIPKDFLQPGAGFSASARTQPAAKNINWITMHMEIQTSWFFFLLANNASLYFQRTKEGVNPVQFG